MSADETSYFVKHRGRVQGPLTIEEIHRAIKRGRVTRAQSVSRDGVSWAPASDYAELFGLSRRPDVPDAGSPSQLAGIELEDRAVEPQPANAEAICWSCPGCRTLLTVSKENAGATAECPSCGKTSVAPGGQVNQASDQPKEWERIAEHLRMARPWVRCLSIFGFVQAGLFTLALVIAPTLALTGLAFGSATSWLGLVLLACCAGAATAALLPSLNLHNYASRINEFLATPDTPQLETVLQAQTLFWRLVALLVLALLSLGLLAVIAVAAISLV